MAELDLADGLSLTSLWTAAARARESEKHDRLFDDPLAAALAGTSALQRYDAEPEQVHNNSLVAVRTRFFDNWLITASDNGVRQVVLLAAGMDTRSFRLAWPEGTTVWELDRAHCVQYKE